MQRHWPLVTGAVLALLAGPSRAGTGASSAPARGRIDYNFQIRPLLADRCFVCHGPDEKKRKADLRLDSAEGVHAAGVIVPGKPEASEVYRRITAADGKHMPPRKSNLKLNAQEIELIRRWIAEGAEYKPHWAFLPVPEQVALPAVADRGWPRMPFDAFVLARLEQEGLKPSPAASREDWIRRASFDLTGLPPSPQDADAFLADRSPEAFERVADRLLASAHFGERMAQDWLDAARYADSFGYQADGDTHVWPYRDWVVQAFNRNLPYDQFLIWQLAGDLLEQPTADQRLATTFCRLNRMTNEGGSIPEEFRNEYVSDRVHTFGTAMLGLTLECCRCHDHKFDPLSMKDYYGLGAFFNSIDEWGTYDNSHFRPTPTLLLPTPEQEKKLAAEAWEVSRLEQRLNEIAKSREAAFRAWLSASPASRSEGQVKPADSPGLVGYYPLDRLDTGNKLENRVDPRNPGTTSPANVFVPGKVGQALRFTGDDEASFPKVAGSLDRSHPFTISFWLQTPAILAEAIVFHRQSGTDTGFHGTQLSFDRGRLFFAFIRFWPGNAMAVRTRSVVPARQWVHVAVSYDGSGKAAGQRIYVNGQQAETEVIRDGLSKNTEAGGVGLTYFDGQTGPSFGARFRSSGLKGCLLDELRVFHRSLTAIEIAQLQDGKSLSEALARKDRAALRPYYIAAVDPETARVRGELQQARERLFATQTQVFEIMTMAELPTPRPAYILARGAYDGPKNRPVGRQTPESLPPFRSDLPRNRLGLARWLVNSRHPLTARVAVNRLWQQFFGRGLVATTENFGTQGALPTHPELLDWLARDFMDSGWDVKALCKKMVLSATYRQSSMTKPELRERDPDNLWLARGPSRRPGAEMLRDAALAAGGLLVEKLGGPPVKPYQPPGLWHEQNSFLPVYVADHGDGLHRRSLYTFWRRTSPPPDMTIFDAPSREVCVVRRQSTSTPLQPLVLLNDPQFIEAARGLGERMLRLPDAKLADRIVFAFRAGATRRPTEREVQLLQKLYEDQRQGFRREPSQAEKYLGVGERPVARDLDPVELAAATLIANAILNLDASTMIR
jgi:Protein of unknown function (DUF1553)/Protein of unknown function (DUF1549)/Concanavalin A-like lectin/glucanases superfamily/Planctomycete cytochrome C